MYESYDSYGSDRQVPAAINDASAGRIPVLVDTAAYAARAAYPSRT
ncbi:MAG: hypothetical protein HOV87_11995 [Catenulispora sp.]|nr:hypothetical protein [Catenulispora sp.]NUT40028.1 hypothetical protein [Thermoactinospora sp.]